MVSPYSRWSGSCRSRPTPWWSGLGLVIREDWTSSAGSRRYSASATEATTTAGDTPLESDKPIRDSDFDYGVHWGGKWGDPRMPRPLECPVERERQHRAGQSLRRVGPA